jgi:hypothetical protein
LNLDYICSFPPSHGRPNALAAGMTRPALPTSPLYSCTQRLLPVAQRAPPSTVSHRHAPPSVPGNSRLLPPLQTDLELLAWLMILGKCGVLAPWIQSRLCFCVNHAVSLLTPLSLTASAATRIGSGPSPRPGDHMSTNHNPGKQAICLRWPRSHIN